MNREIKYRDCIVSQASNNHVMVCKDSEMVKKYMREISLIFIKQLMAITSL